jgi:tetratricopeptide (TPR) repeat protein
LLAEAACSRTPERPVRRMAILPFENLTGDTSLDWVGPAVQTIVSAELAGNPKIVAARAGSVDEGYLTDADRLVHGFFVKGGAGLRIEVQVEDATRHKMVAREAETGEVLPAMNAIAKRLDPSAQAFSTSNGDALAAWGRHDYERAVGIDPDFGAAWLSWTEAQAQRGDQAAAIGVAERALARPGLRSGEDRARIKLLLATLRKDPVAREKAVGELVELRPLDASLLSMAAETEMNLRRFPEAVLYFKGILRAEPADSGVLNLLGYAQAYGGDLDAAKKTLEQYGSDLAQKTNSLDSLGEVHFMHGRFAEAEKYFVEAFQSDAAFADGAELKKAAFARWLGGDLKGADELMGRYLDGRRKAHDPLANWRAAVWDYITGRRDQALSKLSEVSPQLAQRQRAVWSGTVSADLGALKEAYARTAPSGDGEARAFYAAALIAAGQKDEARKLLQLWPLPEEPGDPTVTSLVFPKFIEARHALGLSAPTMTAP